MVGPQTPVYELSEFSEAWDDISALGIYNNSQWAHYKSPAPATRETFYMAPMRYEIGKPDVALTPNATLKIGSYQRNAVVSATSPPLDGHLDSTSVTSIDIQLPIFQEPYSGLNAVVSYWHAIEVFKNGVSLGVDVFSSPVLLNTIYASVATGSVPMTYALASPSTTVEADVWAWDLYVSLSTNQIVPMSMFATNGSGIYSDQYAMFESTTTLFGGSSADAMKFTFSSNGPGGITELDMVTQSGWTRTDTGNTSIQMLNTAGTILIRFNWGQEIPSISYLMSTKYNSPGGFGTEMRYRPADSSDYLSHYVTSLINETYGKWSPASATSFSNLRRQLLSTASGEWHYTVPADSQATGFPSAIGVEPI
jgi:hypothetical protein